jgi:NRAMP (natural resistance-associated macrophage protein)-like metal ion transporter
MTPPTDRGEHSWIGPGVITGASDDDPSGIGTYAQAGARFGTGMLWSMVLSYPLMAAVQMISARIGRVTGKGLAANLSHVLPRSVLLPILLLLFVANVVNIGADLAAMGEAASLLVPVGTTWLAALFGAGSIVLQVLLPYSRYVKILQWLTASLLAYVVLVFTQHVHWLQILRETLLPRLSWDQSHVSMLVAIVGTTISPYLFFWQSAQEVEEQRASERDRPLRAAPEQARRQLRETDRGTLLGMGISNAIGFFVMLTAALTLHAAGVDEVDSAAKAAKALEPLAGQWASAVFALGIVGTGLLAIPVLAGSAGYAAAEVSAWRRGLERPVAAAPRFYAVIAAAGVVGIVLTSFHFNPMKALVWSAVLNGVIAVPVLAAMMLVASREEVMGELRVRGVLRWLGWATTIVMAVGALALAFL